MARKRLVASHCDPVQCLGRHGCRHRLFFHLVRRTLKWSTFHRIRHRQETYNALEVAKGLFESSSQVCATEDLVNAMHDERDKWLSSRTLS